MEDRRRHQLRRRASGRVHDRARRFYDVALSDQPVVLDGVVQALKVRSEAIRDALERRAARCTAPREVLDDPTARLHQRVSIKALALVGLLVR